MKAFVTFKMWKLYSFVFRDWFSDFPVIRPADTNAEGCISYMKTYVGALASYHH